MDINKLMMQAQKMQKEMATKEEELASKTFESSVGGGVVKVIVTGQCQLQSIHIDDSLMSVESKEELQDLIQMAMNSVLGKALQEKNEMMNSLGGSLDIPGLF